jgi:WD40 repeat protein
MMETLPEAKSLLDPPSDGVTALSYLPKEACSHLASTSWDGAVRIHDTAQNTALLKQTMDSGPLLSLATPAGGQSLITGGLDGSGK